MELKMERDRAWLRRSKTEEPSEFEMVGSAFRLLGGTFDARPSSRGAKRPCSILVELYRNGRVVCEGFR